jgi:hypothetical protein
MEDGSHDSRPDTWEHIHRVRGLLGQVIADLQERAHEHDQTKLASPEREAFDVISPRLAKLTYGSDEYRASLREMKPAIQHHYAAYRHHPEHFEDGFAAMNLVDVMEMLADWKAASERHADGDLGRSIEHNAERFGYGPEVAALLTNTARDLGWL